MTKIFPVIHMGGTEQTLEQADVAFKAGADGVYLIDHGNAPIPRKEKRGLLRVIDHLAAVKDAHPDKFVGINMLGGGVKDSLEDLHYASRLGHLRVLPDGLWVDDALGRISPATVEELEDINEVRAAWPAAKSIRILGGVAFKYTPTFSESPVFTGWLTSLAANYLDVVTTSGEGTGKAPSVEKVRTMAEVAHGMGKPLAVASGVDASNLAAYGGVIDEVLVASSVETTPYSGIFDQQKLAELIQIAHDQ